jgi:hypothetical protein
VVMDQLQEQPALNPIQIILLFPFP